MLVVGAEYCDSDVKSWISGLPLVDSEHGTIGDSTYGPLCLSHVLGAPSFMHPHVRCGHSYFPSPSMFCWQSDNANPKGSALDTFFRNNPIIHLVAKAAGMAHWHYAGPMSLVGADGQGEVRWQYRFRLGAKLQREAWAAVGGYPSWLVAVGRVEQQVRSRVTISAALAKWGSVDPYLVITRYDEDVLIAAINAEGLATLYYERAGKGLFLKDPSYRGGAVDTVEFGGDLAMEAPSSAIMSRSEAEVRIAEYIESGTLDTIGAPR